MKSQFNQVKLRPFNFGPNSEMFKVCVHGNPSDALELASSLAAGINQLCSRMEDGVNSKGDLIGCGELRSIAFLGEVIESLVQSVRGGIEDIEDSPSEVSK